MLCGLGAGTCKSAYASIVAEAHGHCDGPVGMGQRVLGCNKGKGCKVLRRARDTCDPGGSKGHCVLAELWVTRCPIWGSAEQQGTLASLGNSS